MPIGGDNDGEPEESEETGKKGGGDTRNRVRGRGGMEALGEAGID